MLVVGGIDVCLLCSFGKMSFGQLRTKQWTNWDNERPEGLPSLYTLLLSNICLSVPLDLNNDTRPPCMHHTDTTYGYIIRPYNHTTIHHDTEKAREGDLPLTYSWTRNMKVKTHRVNGSMVVWVLEYDPIAAFPDVVWSSIGVGSSLSPLEVRVILTYCFRSYCILFNRCF